MRKSRSGAPRSSRPRQRGRALLAGPIVAAVTMLAASGIAHAHDPNAHYTQGRWPIGVYEPYFIATGVPDLARVNTSIVNGANAWNAVNEPMHFSYQGRSSQSILVNQCPGNGHSYVFQRPLAISQRLAETYTCLSGGFINATVITFDNEAWYSDTGQPPANAPDRWSVSSHEFGHGTGFANHWPADSSRCTYSSTRLTMCPNHFLGTTWDRTLGDHDIHTFQAAY